MKDFRTKMFRISEEKMQRVQMMTWMEWLESCFSPQVEVGAIEGLQEKLFEGALKVTMHFSQSQVCGPLIHGPVAPRGPCYGDLPAGSRFPIGG